MYAIAPRGIGKPVGVRAIKPEWELVADEAFKVETIPAHPVLAEDEVSVREAVGAELEQFEDI